MSQSQPDDDELLAVAGLLATGVATELERPLRELREVLARAVDALDHHVAMAKGPTPYPWKAVGELREQLAEAYLTSRTTARLSADLAMAAAPPARVPGAVDVNRAVDAALNLARHRLSAEVEVHVDEGTVPTARGIGSALTLALARLIVRAAAASRGGGRIWVRTRRVDDRAVISVADDAPGDPDADERLLVHLREWLAGSEAKATVRQDRGATVFEIALPVGYAQ